jgi:SAM-dependent methyltransferase
MEYACKICGHRAERAELHVPEMMFGIGETFTYFQCTACGCLQIAEVPADMARHYPPSYYSFPSGGADEAPWRRRLKSLRTRSALEGSGVLDRLLSPVASFPGDIRLWLELMGATQRSRLLDVGCGGGGLLRQLAGLGFQSLLGADPFIAETLHHPDGVVVRKARLAELSGEFDGIMMHHSFEHMPEPYAVLADARRLLAPGASLLLRVPVCSSQAFREYGVDWVQLDAPRHFFLHSEQSLRVLAQRAGFEVTRVVYDSTAFQFWGSEQYRRGVYLQSPTSYAVDAAASQFSAADIAALEAKAREANARGDGDQACFVLRASARP